VDEGLTVLGESLKAAIYFHVGERGSVRREEIPERLQEFTRSLREIFGAGGAVIERLIAKQLYRKLELKFQERHGYGLVEYVEDAKARLCL